MSRIKRSVSSRKVKGEKSWDIYLLLEMGSAEHGAAALHRQVTMKKTRTQTWVFGSTR